MFEQFIKRENDIFDILQIFLDNKLDFILVGGYAISAFKHRFSVDADIIIKSNDLEKFENLLKQHNFSKVISKEFKDIYSCEFIRYQKKEELTVSIDLLINGIRMRQTGFVISFDKIKDNSIKKKIKGLEKEIIAKIPTKELLIAIKLHAGRLTDFRDIVAISKDINIDKIKEFLEVENKTILKKHIYQLIDLLNKKEFIDSFKGVFIEKKYDINIEDLKKFKDLLS